MSKKFSLSAAASKREGESNNQASSITTPKKKIPKVSELTADAPRQTQQRVVTSAPVQICVYKYSENSGELWRAFPDTKLWQVQARTR